MLGSAFAVATEFRFEIGAALLGTRQLQGAVQGLSDSVESLQAQFMRAGANAAIAMGIGPTSVLGVFGKAIAVSEKFKDSQLAISNIIISNREHFDKNLSGPIDDFNFRLAVSEKILKNIANAAKKFGLDEGALLNTSKMIGAQLTAKGMAGTNFGNAIDLSRNFLKSAPTLGIDPNEAQGQLMRAIEGGASGGDTLFRRLASETSAMSQFTKSAQKFNALPTAKRVELLTKALNQFTSSTDELMARSFSLTNSLQSLKNVVGGIDSILKPLGDILTPALAQIVQNITSVLDKEGRNIIKIASKFLEPLTKDIRGTLINFMQLKDVQADLGRTAKALSIGGIVGGLGTAIKFLGGSAMFAHPAVAALGAGIYVLGVGAERAGLPMGTLAHAFVVLAGILGAGVLLFKLGLLGTVISGLGAVIGAVLIPMLALFAIFQTISRAVAIAKVGDALRLPQLLETVSMLVLRLKNAFALFVGPFVEVINAVAEFISPLFSQATMLSTFVIPVFEAFVMLMEKLGLAMMLARATLEGLFFAIFQFLSNMADGKFLNPMGGVGEAFNAGIDSIIEKNLDKLGTQDGAVVQNVTNIAKQENRFEFRENLEPDRIAFAVTQQLAKVSQNRTQAVGRNFSRSAVAGAGGQ